MKWEKSLSLERSVVYLWVAVLFISDGLAYFPPFKPSANSGERQE